MSEFECDKNIAVPTGDVVDNAVGVPKAHWYVAIVKHNSEKKISEQLSKMGIVNYLPIQKEIRVWRNGRKAKVDRMVIPSTIFIHCTELKRREIVSLPFIYRFMTNSAATSSDSLSKPVAVVPDHEIDRLKFMLNQSDIQISISSKPFKSGDKVRIIRGELMGLEGEVMDMKNAKSEMIVALDCFGCARLSIDTANLELINRQ